MPTDCRNPECRDGFTPGIITAGKGTANLPIVGSTMRWGWVKCRACNADKDHPYTPQQRAPGEIAERARLADAKAPYKPAPAPDRSRLERLAAAQATAPFPASSPGDAGRIDRLLDQVSKLTDTVAQLMEENRGLRASLAAKADKPPPGVTIIPAVKPRRVKKADNGRIAPK
jgi:hypothetical protein